MTNLLIMIRNVVLATILAWIGLDFAPSAPEKEDKPSEKSAVLALFN
ncbi:MAG: hypothetical protein KJ833_01275 [Alphaproteobacteria bacterium]|nr:hypothetical protein [Hyphomonas sp.]MBU3919301.1 hypothetical protein [Alphaproteobacteria bacterium]MBU4060629.1 hypothetical protein [Alphaproteobacteria bacterium]MBU4164613.1 hypothetical protein [Alphaproteobacteria bacterium]MBU4567577.1 hypothetical protein [Alphaproteobacteria bacterium]